MLISPRGSRSVHRTAAVVVVAAIALSLGSSAHALPRPGERWLRLESSHFTVFSNAGAAATRRMTLDLESLRATISALSPDTALASPVPTTMFVFKNDDAFRPYKPRYNGRPANLAGYFVAHEHGNYMAVDGNPDGEPQRLVYHEYLHEIVRNNHPGLPLWLNEGLAELYSTFEVVDNIAKIGMPIRSHVAELSGRKLMSFDELWSVDRAARDYNEGTRQGLFYAQSWAFAHYLMIGNAERQRQTKAFLAALHDDVPPRDAFDRAFADGGATLVREVETYIRGYQLPVLAAEVSWSVETGVKATELSHVETLFHLGDLLAHGDASQVAPARAHLEAALREAPDHAGALARLAMLDQLAGDWDTALARYRRAAALAPDDGATQFLLGNALLTGVGEGPLTPGQVSRADRARLLEARAALERSIESRPGYAEAWAQLGFTYTVEAEPPPRARVALETAFRLLPSRMDIAFNLLLIYTRIGARAEARYLVDRVMATRADPATLATAREALLQFDVALANELLTASRYQDVLPVLARLRDATRDPQRRASFDEQIADVRAVIEEQRFVAAYNEAASLANRGAHARAEAVLEMLLPTLTAPELRDRVRSLLERIRAMR